MDIENLENMDKNEFVALETTVKQETIDNGMTDDTATETMAETTAGSATTANNILDNPVCDSAEKQVNTRSF